MKRYNEYSTWDISRIFVYHAFRVFLRLYLSCVKNYAITDYCVTIKKDEFYGVRLKIKKIFPRKLYRRVQKVVQFFSPVVFDCTRFLSNTPIRQVAYGG